jgi:hypothetical protein
MDSSRIEELLKKYWECETSLEEEEQLRAFFQGKNIPEQLKETAGLFQYFESQKKKSLNDAAFDNQVVAKVKTAKSKTIKLLYNSMRIAAGVAVLMVAIWFMRDEIKGTTTTAQVEDTYDDPKLAFEETKKALLIISKSFQSAESKAKKINLFNEAQQEIRKKNEEVKL